MSIKPLTLEVSYEEYSVALSCIENKETALSLPGPLMKWAGEVKEVFDEIADAIGASVTEVVAAFRHKDMFALLKAVGFSMKRLLLAVSKVPTLVTRGILSVMHEIAQTEMIEKLRSGAVKLDAILNKYPVLKMLTGVALAGLLLYLWLNMSFIGDVGFDMDMSVIVDAFRGKFSIADLFLSDEGLATLALFAVGSFTGLSVAWLGSNKLNLLVAMAFTAAKKMRNTGLSLRLKPLLEKKRYTL